MYDEDFFKGGASKCGYVDYELESRAVVRNFDAIIQAINQVVPGGRLLDVGSAMGTFAQRARQSGDWWPQGVELSRFAADYVRDCLHIPVHQGDFLTAPFPPGSFDAITILDTIEHVMEPAQFVRQAAKLLRPGGVLAITTPDGGSRAARIMGKWWVFMVPPVHLVFFDRQTITRCLSDVGLEVLQVRTLGKHFTLATLLYRLTHWFHWPRLARWAVEISRRPLGRLTVRLNLGDIMFVLARKPAPSRHKAQ
jgi:2-polyprenyl-3-methyl-5-hydroxy-6-metoxy-1,4-benzoquinol methylase